MTDIKDPFDFDDEAVAAVGRATGQIPPSFIPRFTLTTKLRNQLIFWLGFCPVTIGGLAWMVSRPQTPIAQQPIVTAAAPQAQEFDLRMSVAAVVDGMVDGQQVGGQDLIRAATKVLQWQESESVQQLANEILVKARTERGSKKALCYRLPEKQCLLKRKGLIESQYDKASDAGNQADVLRLQGTLQALDRLLDGDTQPSAYDPAIYRLARVRRSEGQSQARMVSAGGKAEQQMQIQRGLTTGNLKIGKVGP